MSRRWTVIALIVVAALASVVAATSSGGIKSRSTAAQASAASPGVCGKQLIARVKKLGTPAKMYIPPTPINMKSLAGKKVAFIAASMAFPLVVHLANGFTTAAKYAGITPLVLDGQASVTGYNAAIENAIVQGANAIILDGQNPSLIGSSLADAQAKGIPVISFAAYATPYTQAPVDPIKIYTGLGLPGIGKQMADYAMYQKGCQGSYEIMTSDISATLIALANQAQIELNKECHACSINVDHIPSAQVNTLAPQDARVAFQKDPNTAIIGPDIYLLPVVPAIQSLGGSANGVVAVGYEGDTANLGFVQQGTVEIADDSYPPLGYPGFLLLDTAARVMLGQTPTKPILVPNQFITTDTFKQHKNPFSTFGDFTRAFLKVWGISH